MKKRPYMIKIFMCGLFVLPLFIGEVPQRGGEVELCLGMSKKFSTFCIYVYAKLLLEDTDETAYISSNLTTNC